MSCLGVSVYLMLCSHMHDNCKGCILRHKDMVVVVALLAVPENVWSTVKAKTLRPPRVGKVRFRLFSCNTR